MSSANDLTQSSSVADDTPILGTSCPNEAIVTDEKSSKATSKKKFKMTADQAKKKWSSLGSHTKPQASCSLTHRHQTQTRSHCPQTNRILQAQMCQLIFSQTHVTNAEAAVGNIDLFVSGHISMGQ